MTVTKKNIVITKPQNSIDDKTKNESKNIFEGKNAWEKHSGSSVLWRKKSIIQGPLLFCLQFFLFGNSNKKWKSKKNQRTTKEKYVRNKYSKQKQITVESKSFVKTRKKKPTKCANNAECSNGLFRCDSYVAVFQSTNNWCYFHC